MTEMSDLDAIVLLLSKAEIEKARQAYFGKPSPLAWPVDILFITTFDYTGCTTIDGLNIIAEREGQRVCQKRDVE